jgi:hypothetical protein
MIGRRVQFLMLAVVGVVGCASQSQELSKKEPLAMETALTRGRFDLGCPAATGVVLSSDYLQPAVSGRWAGEGVTRLEYTIGVEGCDKRTTYIVMCQEGSSTCFAAVSKGAAVQPMPQ